ncbi:MAG: site-specific integrase [Melioribacteraceae bacterium]
MRIKKHINNLYFYSLRRNNKFQTKLMKTEKEQDIIDISLKHFMIKFLSYSEGIHSYKHTKTMKGSFNILFEKIGNVNIISITKQVMRDYIEQRAKYVSAATIRRDLATFSSAFKWAIKKKYHYENVTDGIERPKLPEKLPLFFTKQEFEQLINCIENKDLKELVIFAVYTGLRQSDIINLTWEQINFGNRTLLLTNRTNLTKSRKVHSLPLHNKIYDLLNERNKTRINELVFTYLGKPILQDFISKKFRKLIRKAGLNLRLTFHTLRHTFATWLVQNGVSIYKVSKLMTHSDVKVTQIYSHLGTTDLIEAVNMIE